MKTRATPTIVLAVLGIGLVASTGACKKPEEPSPGRVNVDSGGAGNVQIDGVTFEFDSSVRFLYSSKSTNPGDSTSSATVNGHAFGLRDGKVFVGEREYGAASPGTTVQVTSAGVRVGGEMRGPLPAPSKE